MNSKRKILDPPVKGSLPDEAYTKAIRKVRGAKVMELKQNELKVYYGKVPYSKEVVHTELDEALEKCLSQFGYRRWASGYDLDKEVRDLAFDKGEK